MAGKNKTILGFALFLLFLAFLCIFLWQELEPDFKAIHYLESKGYASVRILRQLAEGRGCSPKDKYRFAFDAIPSEGKPRVDGKVCGDGEDFWYEEK